MNAIALMFHLVGDEGVQAAKKSDAGNSISVIVVTAAIGLLAGLATSYFQERQKHKDAQRAEWDRIRVQYLNPIRIWATELQRWLPMMIGKLADAAELKRWYQGIKDVAERRQNAEFADGFFSHCNGELYFAVASQYLLAGYLAQAQRIRKELPYIDYRGLREEQLDDQVLLRHVDAVRDGLAGEYDLWQSIQDSIGEAATGPDGQVVSYRQFCEILADPGRAVWLLRLMDFYRDIDQKKGVLERANENLKELLAVTEKLSAFRI